MPWVDKVKAVIVQFLPGEQAGVALAATLFGDSVSPSVAPVVQSVVKTTHRIERHPHTQN